MTASPIAQGEIFLMVAGDIRIAKYRPTRPTTTIPACLKKSVHTLLESASDEAIELDSTIKSPTPVRIAVIAARM